jgi:uronate dehydrogenase
VVAVRIGSVRPTPTEPRHSATWLSPRDGITLLRAAATQPLTQPFLTVYGTSDNPQHWWPREGWDQLSYHPTDRADDHPVPGPITSHHTDSEEIPRGPRCPWQQDGLKVWRFQSRRIAGAG